MRRLAFLLLALAACRNALGIPGDTSVRSFSVHGTITGLTGISTPTQLMLDTNVATPTADGDFTIDGVANGTVATVTPSSTACVVTAGGDIAIEDADATGLVVVCDGLLAVAGVAPSAPFDSSFTPSEPSPVLTGSVLAQETSFDVTFAYPDVAPTATITFDNNPYTPGTVLPLVEGAGHMLQIDVSSANVPAAFPQPRRYTFMLEGSAAPKAFGYGKPTLVGEETHFGSALAANRDTLVVGMPDGTNGGRAFVFHRAGRSWTEDAVLVGAALGGDRFGTSVAMIANRIVVGSPGTAGGGTVHVFDLAGGQWSETKQLRGTSPTAGDEFGAAVAVVSNMIVVGAPADACGPGGCVFQFPQPSGATVVTKPAHLGDRFGASLAIGGGSLVIGAPGDDSSGPPGDTQYLDAGAAYVATLGSAATLYVKPDAPGADDQFGTAVAIDGDIIVIGAPLEDSGDFDDPTNNVTSGAGAAYIFQFDGGGWAQKRYVKAPVIHVGDNFGRSVAMLANTAGGQTTRVVAIGAPFDNGGATAQDAGAVFAYRFDHNSVTLGTAASANASNVGAGDHFGIAITLTPDSLLVGAPLEDSSDDGWNKPQNEGALDAGAVYSVR